MMRTLVDAAAERLAAAGVQSPRFDAEELLAHVLGVRRMAVGFAADISDEQRQRFEALIESRASRIPLQHLIGSAAFRTVELAVGPGVFVPRPETEVVAGAAIDLAGKAERPVVVDLCTGSGAIALAVATEIPAARVHACELDEKAYEWAVRNLENTGVEVVLADAGNAFPELDGTVDVVVSNPPYIPLDAYESVQEEARVHDPALALWSGEDGLDAVRMIERVAARLLRPGGHVVVEHADVQGPDAENGGAPAIFSAAGRWSRIRDHRDLAGRARYVTARLEISPDAYCPVV